MNASKEEAAKALSTLNALSPVTSVEVKYFDRIAEFLKAAQRKLPTEAAFTREKTRRAKQ